MDMPSLPPPESWQVTAMLAAWALPLYALLYPLYRWLSKHKPCGGRLLLYVYPYAATALMLIGYGGIGMFVHDYIAEPVYLPFVALSFVRLLPLIFLCNIGVYTLLKSKARKK